MKVTLNWVKEFLETGALDPEEISDLLTMSGTEVKRFENIGEKYKNIIIGRIMDYKRHPDADKLSVCQVNTGEETHNIVCGANNFKAGDIVALALPGAVTAQGLKIGKSKLRGVLSEGMMCSEFELGLSAESEGIMILEKDFEIGKSFASQLGLDDIVLELEVTPNRPDCFCIIGIAREISALKKIPFKNLDYGIKDELNADQDFTIDIKDLFLCSRYSGKIFSDIPKKITPRWMQNRLIMCDYRPIDLVVDLTNYVMHETGQPLHAFDRDLLSSDRIIVRTAKAGEKLRTIDDTTRNLDEKMLLIADEKNAIAVAGVMGGKETEINPNTKNVFLESANFFGPSIMKTSKKLGLRSEASNRFEKKIDPEITTVAIKRFEELLSSITKAIFPTGIYDSYDKKERERKIQIRTDRVKDVLGEEIPAEAVKDILERLGIKSYIEDKAKGIVQSTIPSFRFEDLEREIDLIEEIARLYGFDRFSPAPPVIEVTRGGRYSKEQKVLREIKQALSDIGLYEVINYSFLSAELTRKLKLDTVEKYRSAAKIINPINEDFALLKTTTMPLMLKNLAVNINRGQKDISIFEISKVFRDRGEGNLPEESNHLGIMLTGRAELKSWDIDERGFSFFDLKGILEYIAEHFIRGNVIEVKKQEYKFFHPALSGDINIDGEVAGIIGKIHPAILDGIDISQDIFYLEIDLDLFISKILTDRKYSTVSSFPGVDIDIAIVVDDKVDNSELIDTIREEDPEILRSVRLFDIYKGKQIEEGKKSLAYSLSFMDDSRTLKDPEVDLIIKRILERLSRKFNARLRE